MRGLVFEVVVVFGVGVAVPPDGDAPDVGFEGVGVHVEGVDGVVAELKLTGSVSKNFAMKF